MIRQPFTNDELAEAADAWGCNCGPAALAFALQIPLWSTRYALPRFVEKRHTTPTMMREALAAYHVTPWVVRLPEQKYPTDIAGMFDALGTIALVRVQWTGPWTAPGINPKWGYVHSHWIAAWRDGVKDGGVNLVYDVNSGISSMQFWEYETVQRIIAGHARADGGWFPTHIWRVRPPIEAAWSHPEKQRVER